MFNQTLFCVFATSILTLAHSLVLSSASAQVTPDGTPINTQVNQNGNVAEITGGQTSGGNLFHSFQDFSVPTGNEAFFNNADSISNILSRVTGGNISNIDGLIRANGSANLFLINPAGIIFGENASLSIGGSFYGSTADSILFEDGEFSAVDNLQQPILTINAPIGLSFRDEPGEIVNRSRVENSSEEVTEVTGLEISSGNNLAFVGGNINFESGNATARGGNIYLGGLAEAGIVNLNQDGSLSFPDDLNKANITLTNAADVDVQGTGGGNIRVEAQNLSLARGELGRSLIRGGISSNSTNPEAIAGDVTINVAENITLNESIITNRVLAGGIGNAGNVTITTDSIELINSGSVNTLIEGQGNAGAVNVTARGNITADGDNSEGLVSGIGSQVNEGATGDAGGVNISTKNLNLTNGSTVASTIFGQEGNAGAVNVTATGNITVDGESSLGTSSAIGSGIAPGATGDSGGVNISTTNLNLTNGGGVSASTFGQGNAGAINVTATGNIMADGEDSGGFPSGITSQIAPDATGDSGGITISTTNLNLTNGSFVDATTFGQGNAGAVNITATGNITVDGFDSEGFPSGISSVVNPGATGDAGGVTISTTNLNLTNGGQVAAATFGQGNANDVSIDATESIFIDGAIARSRSGISANAQNEDGNGGNIFISTGDLTIANGGTIEATNFDNIGEDNPGTGRPGTVTITADSVNLTDARIEAATQFTGEASGIINFNIAEELTLDNNSFISAQAFGEANGGNLNIDARYIIAFPSNGTGNDLVATADRGTGGSIDLLDVEGIFGLQPGNAIAADNQFIENGTNDIDASSNVEGFDGTISIDPSSFTLFRGVTELPTNIVVPEQTVTQACRSDRASRQASNLTIKGKGGITPNPSDPLDTLNVYVDGEGNNETDIPEAVETSQGKIQPARGVRATDKGIMLTAYRTNNKGDRIPESNSSCDRSI